jgi:uncharacterized membrane protein YcaP (DUF421 family)
MDDDRGSAPQAVMSQPISLADIHRVLFGDASPMFLLEVFVRTFIAYLGIIAALRILGARVAGQFTLFEVSVAVTIAAAVGGPLQSSDRGMLPAVVMVVVLMLLQYGIARLSSDRKSIQRLLAADVTLLVKDGEMQLSAMKASGISREQIFANLRSEGCLQLGEIARLYMEPSGKFTFIRADTANPGLSFVPSLDQALRQHMVHRQCFACCSCGHVEKSSRAPAAPCSVCHAEDWQEAARMPE